MGARFALVLEPKGGPRAPVALRLIDASGQERDAALVTPATEAGMIDSAVMRLDETARRLAQTDAAIREARAAARPAPTSRRRSWSGSRPPRPRWATIRPPGRATTGPC